MAALKRYNNVQLDGKAMKIEVIGTNIGLPVTPRINVVGGGNGRGRRTVVMTYVVFSHSLLSGSPFHLFYSLTTLPLYILLLIIGCASEKG